MAASADEFVCIVDETKSVDVLGGFPLPVEVIPMARGLVARAAGGAGRQPGMASGLRSPTTATSSSTCTAWPSPIPPALESTINNLAGVVTNGIFAAQAADLVLVATPNGVERF